MPGTKPLCGLKPKNLLMLPARLALALQADGWWVRSEVIWAKPNPMPESITDRPTCAHEKVFLLAKSAKYFYDADAVRETAVSDPKDGRRGDGASYSFKPTSQITHMGVPASGRNLRNVWTIPTQPYPESHFATYPERLVEPCVKAGTSEKGCCPECGAPWKRRVVVERSRSGTSEGMWGRSERGVFRESHQGLCFGRGGGCQRRQSPYPSRDEGARNRRVEPHLLVPGTRTCPLHGAGSLLRVWNHRVGIPPGGKEVYRNRVERGLHPYGLPEDLQGVGQSGDRSPELHLKRCAMKLTCDCCGEEIHLGEEVHFAQDGTDTVYCDDCWETR